MSLRPAVSALTSLRALPALFLALGTAGLVPLAHAADAPAGACIAVIGQGRNLSETDARANDQWNRINAIFNRAVETALAPSGRPIVTFQVPVEGSNLEGRFELIMKLAGAETCDTLVETTMFADQTRHAFVSRVMVHEVVATKRPIPQPPTLSVGRELLVKERLDPLTQETLDHLAPNDVAHELVAPYLASLGH
jgi:hypothetical protein